VIIDDDGPLIDKIPKHVVYFSLNRKHVSRSIVPILKAVWTVKPDVLVTSIFHLNLAIIMLRPFFPLKTKVVIRESNLPSIALNRERSPTLFKLLIKRFYRKADRVISLGDSMSADLIDYFHVPEKLISIIPNPVDIDHIETLSRRYENPFGKSKYNFLAVGSLTSQKGFDILISAMESIAKEHIDAHLSILGDGPLKKELKGSIFQKGLSNFISICGFRDNPYPYFYHADRFVLSSRYEGLPNVILESLALGTPVIALDNPGCLRDIVKNDKQGVLVTPCTAGRLADEMLKAYRLGAPETKESLLPGKFLLKNVISRYEALFDAL